MRKILRWEKKYLCKNGMCVERTDDSKVVFMKGAVLRRHTRIDTSWRKAKCDVILNFNSCDCTTIRCMYVINREFVP